MQPMIPRTVQIAVDFMSDPRELDRLVELSEQGDVKAQILLGGMYYEGRGVPRDYEQALKWFTRAAEQGEPNASYAIGGMYFIGHGVSRNLAQAVEWFRKAAERNHADAQRALGWIYERGQGVARDRDEAVRWFVKAAKQGHKGARKKLLKMGVSLDRKDAARVRPKKVEKEIAGDAVASLEYPEDVRGLLRLAERNDGQAQYKLGRKYYEGHEVQKNLGKAFQWFRKAAGQGVVEAQFCMGISHHEQAVKWFRKAARQGYPKAQFNLGMMYLDGRGVSRDVDEAIKWFRRASKQGHAKAVHELDRLGLA